MSNTKGTGENEGVPTRTRGKAVTSRDHVAADVRDRALELLLVAYRAGHWKSSVLAKARAYLETLLFGRKTRPPQGLPGQVLLTIQRCLARACLELEAEGLAVQVAEWYPAAAENAKREMRSS